MSNFTAEAELASESVVFEWNPPQEPNGIIIAYQLTYRVRGSHNMERNFTGGDTMFTLNLPPGTVVSDISVRAYTSAGPGDTVTIDDVAISPATQTQCEYNRYESLDCIIIHVLQLLKHLHSP